MMTYFRIDWEKYRSGGGGYHCDSGTLSVEAFVGGAGADRDEVIAWLRSESDALVLPRTPGDNENYTLYFKDIPTNASPVWSGEV
jgi:hypothetical protein